MNGKDENFLKKLMNTFKIEADEHIKVISAGLLELEQIGNSPEQEKIVETIFREAHSFKGAARAVNLSSIEVICKSLESIFDSWKRHKTAVTPETFDALHKALDFLTKFLAAADAKTYEAEKESINKQASVIRVSLESFLNQPKELEVERITDFRKAPAVTAEPIKEEKKPAESDSAVKEKTIFAETIRIHLKKLDSLFLKTEELFSTKMSLGDRVEDLNKVLASFGELKKERGRISDNIRTLERELKHSDNDKENAVRKNDTVLKLVEYLNWNDGYSKTIEQQLSAIAKSLKQNHRSIEVMTTNLLEEIKNVLMFPFSSLLEIFPKVIRELSHDQKKDVSLDVHGAEIEIDKRILEELKDPFMHLIRNCIDHGIEKSNERKQKGKNPRGLISIEIAQKESGKVEINFSDDGAGVDLEKVRTSALKQKLISDEDAGTMNDQQILSLVFHSGVSSSALITDISGRGLGLAIVREKVEKLGGSVSIKSRPGVGTSFQIILPLTLATFHGIFVRLDEQFLVIPTANVKRVIRVKKNDIKTVENKDTILLDGKVFSLVKLSDILGIELKESETEQYDVYQVVIVSSNENELALIVDEILGEQEVLIKPLGKQLTGLENISSVTVLGNGKVVPVLNVFDLMKSSAKVPAAKSIASVAEKEDAKQKSVLVAEDSITARALLKNILEVAGYEVTTAVDGLDAFTQLKTKNFDIVVSDVDMPRMSGFDLTLKIRSEKKFSNTPVVLVTALESKEDRERGIDVGANAYIVKSSFDQKNLLEVIRQLT
ncbi:MAG: hybrid sensor histidine kinase/response regulator [Bacteroidota bacterium]